MTAPTFHFPCPVADFIRQLPPMRFIDTVLAVDDEGAESITTIAPDSIALNAQGRFSALGLIEVMAQTIGIYAGHRMMLLGEAPRLGLLLGTRRMTLPIADFAPGDILRSRVEKCFESDDGLWQFACEVRRMASLDAEWSSGEPAGNATLTVFNPPEGYFDAEAH